MEKEQKQELVSVLPIPAFHLCEPLCVACTVYMLEWVIQIPSIPILVSVLFPSLHLKYFRIKFLLLVIYYRTYVGVCVTPFLFFFGVRCAQYKVHAQCSFAALAPHMPCMLLVMANFFLEVARGCYRIESNAFCHCRNRCALQSNHP